VRQQQFFHGSHAFLQPGDIIEPGSGRGVTNYPQVQKWRSQHVWLTDEEKNAWGWAHLGRRSDTADRRLSVYRVEPAEPPLRRRKLGGGPAGAEYTTHYARVVERLDIPHPEADIPREYRGPKGGQGTLPLPEAWHSYDVTWGGHKDHPARTQHFWNGTGPDTATAWFEQDRAMERWKHQERLEGLRSKGRYARLAEPRLF
jgi:hypothetical protein